MNPTKGIRTALDSTLDALEMLSFNQGFEAALNGIEEVSNAENNRGNTTTAETLLWLARELRGENA